MKKSIATAFVALMLLGLLSACGQQTHTLKFDVYQPVPNATTEQPQELPKK